MPRIEITCPEDLAAAIDELLPYTESALPTVVKLDDRFPAGHNYVAEVDLTNRSRVNTTRMFQIIDDDLDLHLVDCRYLHYLEADANRAGWWLSIFIPI